MNKLLSKTKSFFKREGRSADGIFALALAVIVALNIFLYVLVEAFGLYLYEKPQDDLSISGNTDALFAEAVEKKSRIKLSFCMPKEDILLHKTGSYVHTTALNFQERYPSLIEIEYINVMTRRNSKGELVDLARYQKDMRGEEVPVLKTSVIFECGANYRVITDAYSTDGFAGFFTLSSSGDASAYNGEEVMAAMLSWVLRDEHKSVYFTQHHGESVDVALSNLLVCAGYYVDTVDLRNEPIPEDAEIVYISNPRADFERAAEGSGIVTEIERLKNYIARGGNLFVSLDPYVKTLTVLEEFIAEYGIGFSTSETSSGRVARNIVKDSSNAITVDGFTLVTEFADSPLSVKIAEKIRSFTDGDVIIREASALTLSADAKPLLLSSSSSEIQAGGERVDSAGGYTVAAYNEIPAENGLTAAVVVVPSIYLTASDALVSRGYCNKDFAYAVFEELFGAPTPPYGTNAVIYDTLTLQNLTMRRAKIYTALILSVPVILAAAGAVVIIKRKNR